MRRIRVNVAGRWYTVEVGDLYRNPLEVIVEGQRYLVELESSAGGPVVKPALATEQAKQTAAGLRGIIQGNDRVIRCPMPGRIVAVSTQAGSPIEPGDELCVLETMKMEQSVRSSHSGNVEEVLVRPGQNVRAGSPLVRLAE